MRETRRHRAQRGETLAVLLALSHSAHHRRDLAHHALVNLRLCESQALEILRGDRCHATVGLGLHAHPERAAGKHGDRSHPGWCRVMADRLASTLSEDQRLSASLEQQLQTWGLLALLGDDPARVDVASACERYPLGQIRVTETVEQVDTAQLLQRDWRLAHASTRYSWINDTAIEPSPTALATRLIERARTSPATKTPGTVLSRT